MGALPKAGTPVSELKCKECGKTLEEAKTCVAAECPQKANI